ncbi:diacylglycerol/lipid kinase family protein [Terriglobus aquaticus]|uniref:Diacylglycerol/lipid kinase family protein n=1 Tax=Terriglobus aquaticus TaxID=940139 RepID=A0ABW9KMW9_9BACT|nr:diacylglycerol kinase family protein [Terriglobus aquaticus]
MLPSKLLYNPAAGRQRERRSHVVQGVIATLRSQGFHVESEATRAKGSGAQQAADAVRQGAAAVFACGGDGTVHDVLQGIAGTGASLGIIPCGSANALAQELRIPSDPLRAATLLHPQHSIQLRTMAVHRGDLPTLYSLCMAGAGPDGLLMYRMLTVNRGGLGRWRYYEHALRLFCSHRFPKFQVEVQQSDGSRAEHTVVSAMGLRIGDLQGIFRGIGRGASIHDPSLHVILVAPPARLTLPLWFVLAWLGLARLHPGITICKAQALVTQETVPLQVDGEWAGHVITAVTMAGPLQRVLTPAPVQA